MVLTSTSYGGNRVILVSQPRRETSPRIDGPANFGSMGGRVHAEQGCLPGNRSRVSS